MIMMPKKKNLASIVLSSAYGEPSAENNSENFDKMASEPEGTEAELLEIASDIMKAFHAKDVVSLRDALIAFDAVNDQMEDSMEGE